MKVISITPRGFCKGVTKAIKAVKNAVNNPMTKKPIYVLGYIVHNKYVVDELTGLGVITLDDSKTSRIDLAKSVHQGTVILSAHGTDESVKTILESKNVDVIDATCEDVLVTFNLIKNYSKQEYHTFYIGKKDHPEALAALSLTEHISLIENIHTIPNHIERPIFITNQTTYSMTEIKPIIDKIIDMYPQSVLSEEICNATRLRQSAIIDQNEDVDLCYVVGDTRSNNTKNLVFISETVTKTPTKLIQSVDDINDLDLKNIKTVSVSSGASTPSYLTKAVIDYLKNY